MSSVPSLLLYEDFPYGNTTPAPSEKHLENWLEQNADTWITPTRFLARQVVLPSGIADVVLFTRKVIYVAELKKGKVDGSTMLQLLRYMGDLQSCFSAICYSLLSRGVIDFKEHAAVDGLEHQRIQGVLIGYTFDEGVELALQAAGVNALQYTYIPETDGYRLGFAARTPRQQAIERARWQGFDVSYPHIASVIKDIAFDELRRIEASDDER